MTSLDPLTISSRPEVGSGLPDLLEDALSRGEVGLQAFADPLRESCTGDVSRLDRVRVLASVYALQSGAVTSRSQWADHPAVASLRWRLERQWLSELAAEPVPERLPDLLGEDDPRLPEAVAKAMRWLAAHDRLPAVYTWAAKTADRAELVHFLNLEGGPDAGFDDLVAVCQIGLGGSAKLELAVNYWDEMGNGDLGAVHTAVHDDMAQALGLVELPADRQPIEALERAAFGGLLAANHWLKPEMLGALGLIELQAGPRCRLVLQGLERVGAPAATLPFYSIHAEVDPRHGRDWLEKAIIPMVAERPEWAPRIVRGAWWRSVLNARFFDVVARQLGIDA